MSKDKSKGYVLAQISGANPVVKGGVWVDVTIRFHYTPKAQHDSNPMADLGELPGLGTMVRLVEVDVPKDPQFETVKNEVEDQMAKEGKS